MTGPNDRRCVWSAEARPSAAAAGDAPWATAGSVFSLLTAPGRPNGTGPAVPAVVEKKRKKEKKEKKDKAHKVQTLFY